MNILGDFINRVNSLYPEEIDNDQLNSLLTTIRNQGEEIEVKDKEINDGAITPEHADYLRQKFLWR